MDKVIQETWQGHVEIKNSIFDYSTSYNLINDKYDLFTSDQIFMELKHKMLTFDNSEKTHFMKFHVWINSM